MWRKGEMASLLYNESFVLYESVYRMYQRLYKQNKEIAADYMNAVMAFGIDGEMPEEDNVLWLYGLDNAFASIDSAKTKRVKNIEDGAKGGRRRLDLDMEAIRTMIENGMSYQEIAKELGVSKSTIQRRVNEANNALVSNDVKCQNLNVNDNENDNDNDNEKVNDKSETEDFDWFDDDELSENYSAIAGF